MEAIYRGYRYRVNVEAIYRVLRYRVNVEAIYRGYRYRVNVEGFCFVLDYFSDLKQTDIHNISQQYKIPSSCLQNQVFKECFKKKTWFCLSHGVTTCGKAL